MLNLLGALSDPGSLTGLYVYGPLGVFAAYGLWFIKQTVDRLVLERNADRDYTRTIEEQWRTQMLESQRTLNDALNVVADIRSDYVGKRRS